MQKIISLILLAALLIGMLTLAACQPPQDKTDANEESTTQETNSDEPASDTELISTEGDTTGGAQSQN
ncbi:MAG TPA: hypothetical protein PLI58_05060 [Candidatus Syntrophosphaera sp.]|jgi:ABC-type oligopeptide transport system substrate-binding subunit|nr:hypothetical protein [Candidatus Cloacimonadota bacterium]OQB89678.1 MAG: hypothetical protein BWX83_01064 [Candidatus Cloacimonetes bacterium ADurb.Bin117]HNU53538.1 hypothetical protein [Candidatus Syntrophosphaera sp.]MDI9524102.1 hypothetical protein [Candidatus Cloacimonadota bacterium]NLH93667.1 hypothetical protein [Candidatus Cloacimonadota bacterium]